MKKLVQSYEALLGGWRIQKAYAPIVVPKKSFASTILGFFGLRQESAPTSSNSYYGLLCSYCGADREVGDKFCRICGQGVYPPT